jgi:hypothetical protein
MRVVKLGQELCFDLLQKVNLNHPSLGKRGVLRNTATDLLWLGQFAEFCNCIHVTIKVLLHFREFDLDDDVTTILEPCTMYLDT